MLAGTGLFTYAENHFVINHEKCVEYDSDGVPHLTDFAWAKPMPSFGTYIFK